MSEFVTTLYVGKLYKFAYTNHESKFEERQVRFESISYGRSDYHGEEYQWFLNGYCYDRNARRTFAMKDIEANTVKEV